MRRRRGRRKPGGDDVRTRKAAFLLTDFEGTGNRKGRRRWRRRRREEGELAGPANASETKLRFDYDYDELILGEGVELEEEGDDDGSGRGIPAGGATAVVLIQPVGVGIGRWYYGRLLSALKERFRGDGFNQKKKLIFLAPDLLGCGTACNPMVVLGSSGTDSSGPDMINRLPLLNVKDWASQIESFMAGYEDVAAANGTANGLEWCVVANGGCTPIALEVGKRYTKGDSPFQGKLDQIVLSAPPRLPTLLRASDATKVAKSYQTLSGIAGRLFWWYSLRNGGAFIRRFSEKNLMSKPEYLGEDWTSKCVHTASAFDGKSRFSTFAFLAGSLQVGFGKEMFDALKGGSIMVNIIRGGDKRPNKSRSWFWEKRKKIKKKQSHDSSKVNDFSEEKGQTLAELLHQNGNGGCEVTVAGRRCPAHEDADGFAAALLGFLDD